MVSDHDLHCLLTECSIKTWLLGRFSSCYHLDGQERAGCFAWFVFLVSRDGCVALPRGAMSAVCDCGIS